VQIHNYFVVPASIEEAWTTLLDVERLVPCMPGASLDSYDGERVDGKVRVKLGPITVSYVGTATFVIRDSDSRHVAIRATGRERTGAGTADARITADLVADGDRTRVVVTTDLDITGRPAQFGRGMIASVAQHIIDRFAANLAETMTAAATEPVPVATSGAPRTDVEGAEAETRGSSSRPPLTPSPIRSLAESEAEPLDVMALLRLGELTWAKSLPYAAAVLLGLVVGGLCARRTGQR
jgi:carbon monoxide dehydrogenase subunit G